MLRKRLNLQIYATIIFSLLLVVGITGLTLWVTEEDNDSAPEFKQVVGTFVTNALPAPDLPNQEQQKAVMDLLEGIDIDFNLFDKNGELVASKGENFELPENYATRKGWQRFRNDQGWLVELKDGRWLFIGDPDDHNPLAALFRLVLILSSVALAIGLASYPLVCRLTNRLEKLKSGVERVGLGDLTARVDVEGKDEIASLAESFNHSAEQIERLVTSHKTLLANASHELRTPLSRIRLGLEMYQDTHDEKRLKALKGDILELDSLIEEIMLMSRLDNNTASMVIEIVNLQDIITEEAGRYPDVTISGSIEEIFGNARLFRRLVQNLIGNAFKHGAPPVDITLGQDKNTVHFTITDNGNGVPKEERSKIFERFYRGSDRQNVEGYGLGLPLVKQIIDAHEGQLEILDQNKGFSIKIHLPIQNAN